MNSVRIHCHGTGIYPLRELREVGVPHTFSKQLVDILKIDVEGFEAEILAHLEMEALGRINRIYAEMITDQKVPGFLSERYGGVTRYYRA